MVFNDHDTRIVFDDTRITFDAVFSYFLIEFLVLSVFFFGALLLSVFSNLEFQPLLMLLLIALKQGLWRLC